jgi:hypothetical protein
MVLKLSPWFIVATASVDVEVPLAGNLQITAADS